MNKQMLLGIAIGFVLVAVGFFFGSGVGWWILRAFGEV